MDERQQYKLLHKFRADVQKVAGCELILKQNEGGSFSIKIAPHIRCKKRTFAYANIRPQIGCLSVATYEKGLTKQTIGMIKYGVSKQRMHWEDTGVKWLLCDGDDKVYKEAVSAFSMVCKYCL